MHAHKNAPVHAFLSPKTHATNHEQSNGLGVSSRQEALAVHTEERPNGVDNAVCRCNKVAADWVNPRVCSRPACAQVLTAAAHSSVQITARRRKNGQQRFAYPRP